MAHMIEELPEMETELIAEHSVENLMRQDPIRVVFTKDIVEKSNLAQGPQDIFSTSPKLEGTTKWVSPREVQFIPQKIAEGTSYTVTVDLKKIDTKTKEEAQSFPILYKEQKFWFEVAVLVFIFAYKLSL